MTKIPQTYSVLTINNRNKIVGNLAYTNYKTARKAANSILKTGNITNVLLTANDLIRAY